MRTTIGSKVGVSGAVSIDIHDIGLERGLCTLTWELEVRGAASNKPDASAFLVEHPVE
jgi:hypothetical protein